MRAFTKKKILSLLLLLSLSSSAQAIGRSECPALFAKFSEKGRSVQTEFPEEVVVPEEWFAHQSLESEIAYSELPKDAVDILKMHSGGLLTLPDFYKKLDVIQPRYKLGLDHFRQVSDAILHTTSISRDAYAELGVSGADPDHTDKIMRRLLATGKPVVFFVPRKILTHEAKNATANEMLWLLNTPRENLKNFYFVFGAYDLFTAEGAKRYLGRYPGLQDRIRAMRSVFTKIKRENAAPK